MDKLNKKILLLQSVYTTMSYFCTGYLIQAFQRFGFNNALIGTTMMLTALTATICQPVWGYISDKKDNNKLIIGICCFLSGIALFVLIFSGGRVALVIAMAIILYALFQPMAGLIDSWISKFIMDGYNINYSATRAGGSFAYALTVLGSSVLIYNFGMFVTPFIYTFFSIFLYILLYKIPTVKSAETAETRTMKDSLTYLKTNSRFIIYIIAYFFTSISSVLTSTFYSVVIFSLGGNELHAGMGLFLSAICELPALIFYRRIKNFTRLSSSSLMFIGMLFYAVKATFIAFAPNLTMAILANMLHGLSFAVFLPASLDFLSEIVERKHFSTAYMVSISIGSSFPSFIANPIGGRLSDKIGVQNMLKFVIIFAVIGASIIGLSHQKYKKTLALKN